MRGFMLIMLVVFIQNGWAISLLLPMDNTQANHLKAYGIAFFALKRDISVNWLLNYKGGSFLMKYSESLEKECTIRGITFQIISDRDATSTLNLISSPSQNLNVVRMDRAPRIAVYSPKNELINDETDAVITVLDYAEIPYQLIYDKEVLEGALSRFDWLHLHHEDFTGQSSKGTFRQSSRIEFKLQELTAAQLGYAKVSALKFDVAKKIHAFVSGGGYLFAMCSGAETFDIALAAQGEDIESGFYEEGIELDFTKSLAFENYELKGNSERSFSDINTGGVGWTMDTDGEFFQLFDFSAKWDIVPAILNQNHETYIREFSGLTTAFNPKTVKPGALVLAENKAKPNVRYIYGELGHGHFTYYGGHDPEGRWGGGGRNGMGRKTDLNLFPHSPGYRLILNNVLFPSANKKKRKT